MTRYCAKCGRHWPCYDSKRLDLDRRALRQHYPTAQPETWAETTLATIGLIALGVTLLALWAASHGGL